jgi:uncharacterized RDD family membrane protein YckC
MVISWDKSENNPNLPPPVAEVAPAGEVTQPPVPKATLPADRPLGRRVAAAFIDLGLLVGLEIIMSLLVGPTSPAIGPVSIHLFNLTYTSDSGAVLSIGLYGPWAALFVILVACYYFALEALTGQTVGKALLGLRVLRTDGAKARSGPIAIRTFLRLADGLPAFYLLGFIVMLITGRRRLRLGDLAADTIVVRTARSFRSLVPALACVAVVVLATAGLSAAQLASPAGSQAYRGHGISFSYPAGWAQGHSTSMAQTGDRLWNVTVGPGNDTDFVIIESYRLAKVVGPGDLGAVAGELHHLIQGQLQQQGDAILHGPRRTTLASMPGVRFQIGGYLRDGTPFQSILTFAFTGTTEYLINCQTSMAGQPAIAAGCAKVIRTFRTAVRPAAHAPASPPTTLPSPPLSAPQWRHGLRLLLAQMNRTREVSGVVTRAKLRAEASQLQRCAPGLARLGNPAPRLRRADKTAVRACAQFTRAATCYAAAAQAFDPLTVTSRFDKKLHCGDAAANAGSMLIAQAVALSVPS